MPEYIVDTNVPLSADGLADHMSPHCFDLCAQFLEGLFNGDFILVLDSNDLILTEYEIQMPSGTNSSFGRIFLKWVYNNQWNPSKVKRIKIHPNGNGSFIEIPQKIIDVGFDKSDLKFVAVAVANAFTAPIAQAADSKWIGWHKVLALENIHVKFLCELELREIYKRKIVR